MYQRVRNTVLSFNEIAVFKDSREEHVQLYTKDV